MTAFLKSRWILLLVLAVFIICKIPCLHYAYYWDESYPYASAVGAMYHHGASLVPNAVDAELSRGHPLFFHAATALWMDVFGDSHISRHSFALFISMLTLIAVYEAGLTLFNQRVAVISILLVSTQVFFIVQSAFVLPEMLVALLTFTSLYFYTKDKYLLTILSLTALFYTKESGLVAGFVLGIYALIGLFNKRKLWKQRLLRAASVFIPCLLIGAFFVMQDQERGWYIYPGHRDLIEHTWRAFLYNFRMNCVGNTFHEYLRYYYYLLLLLLSVLAAIKNRSGRYLALFFPAILIYYNLDRTLGGQIPGVPYFILFVLSLLCMLYMLITLGIYTSALQRKFTVLTVAFIYCYFIFSAMNFFTYRYLLAAVVPLSCFTAVVFDALINRTYPGLYYPVLLLILVISFFQFKTDDAHGDCDPGTFDGLEVQQHVVNWFEKNNYYDKVIGCGPFQEMKHLQNPSTGFLHTDKAFNNVSLNIDTLTTGFIIFDDIENDNRYNEVKNSPAYSLVYRYQKGTVWAEVYGRK